MNDSDSTETFSGTLALRPDTSPIPIVAEAAEVEVIHHTYPQLEPETLDAEWHETGDGEGWRVGPFNHQVYRALEAIAEGIRRNRDDHATIARAGLLLMFDPSGDGTPMRCEQCAGVYTVGDGQPDWNLAGRRSGVCWPCTTAPKTIVVTPAQVRPSRRRRTQQPGKAAS